LRVATVSYGKQTFALPPWSNMQSTLYPKEQAIRLNCSVYSDSVYAKLHAARPMG
jgi:hypothetical protein